MCYNIGMNNRNYRVEGSGIFSSQGSELVRVWQRESIPEARKLAKLIATLLRNHLAVQNVCTTFIEGSGI